MHPEQAGRLVAWAAAVAAGHASIATAADVIEAGTSGHVVTGTPSLGATSGTAAELPLREALDWLRRAGPCALTFVLPTWGDPLGLGTAGTLTQAAVLAETAVVVSCVDNTFGWVPEPDARGSSYAGVRWRAYPGSAMAPTVDIAADRIVEQADRALRRALREATEALAEVDLARWRAEAAAGREAAEVALRTRARAMPPSWPAPARALGERALALWQVVRIAASDSGAISASGATVRADALRTLSHAVREAAMTAYNVPAAVMLGAARRS